MEQNDGREPDEYRGDAVTGEGRMGVEGSGTGQAAGGDPYEGDAVTGEGGVGRADVDPDPVDDANPETDGVG